MTGFGRVTALLLAASATACGSSDPQREPVTIDRIVALSDGDYAASTYADGLLAPPGHRDLLSTVSVRDGVVSTAQVEVSNSVTAAPEVLALSPDGSTAFVAERLARRTAGDVRASDLAAGTRVFAVDLADPPRSPRLRTEVVVADMPEAIAVHPDGSHVAAVSNTADAAVLQVIPWTGAEFGAPARFDLAALGIVGAGDGPRGGVTATNVQWHPSGRGLAVNLNTQDRVAFFSVDAGAGGAVSVRPWGDPVETGADPFVGRFTPDGRFYLTSDWGRDLATTNLEQRMPADRSRITVISTGDPGTDGPRAVGSAESDKSAEGIAVSPDGRMVATVNMRGTALPPQSPKYDAQASVSLLRLDTETGQLSKVGDYPLDGVLPEGGTFDSSGDYFLATVFEGRPGSAQGAGVQVYRVDPDAGLTPAQRIPLAHGVHHVAVS